VPREIYRWEVWNTSGQTRIVQANTARAAVMLASFWLSGPLTAWCIEHGASVTTR